MHGAGFTKDMIAVTRNNRELLKKESSRYRNFDKSYISDSIISRKAPVYREADPQFLEALRKFLRAERRRHMWRRVLAGVLTIAVMSAALWYFLF